MSDGVRRVRRAAVHALAALPDPILRALAGGRIERDGAELDPDIAAALRIARLLGRDRIDHLPVPAARARARRGLGDFDAAPRPMAQVIDTFAGAIPVRVYRPRRAAPALIVYFHGGGGVIGSVASYDPTCRVIADETRCVVASIEYRLAPEHPYPAAVDDAVAAWRWARTAAPALGADPARIALAGDSMGGYLAVMADARTRDEPRPAALGLVYPLLDLTMSSPSIDAFADGFLLTRTLMTWFVERFCPDPAPRRAASPLFFDDATLAGSPPTLVVTGGFDPLRDEGRAWVARLAAAGVHAVHREHASLVHGFLGFTGANDAARVATEATCGELRALLAVD